MYIRYQKIRNTVVGTFTAGLVAVGAYFGFKPSDTPSPLVSRPALNAVQSAADEIDPVSVYDLEANTMADAGREAEVVEDDFAAPTSPPHSSADVAQISASSDDPARYIVAMKLAMADASGQGKDVLGASSPWKLNLYDDDRDGRWDRGKLDRNRDEVDDEKWNFKNGVWEKDGGAMIWLDDHWGAVDSKLVTSPPGDSRPATMSVASPDLVRYQAAMRIALARADASGKGKDVLGASSPWKLNLYDDDRDGRWDRAKLDSNRDEVDDEKWTFKQGRWEKDGGAAIWDGSQWQRAASN